ncbi:MAG TPA: UxaA family hydrolase [Bacillales bacterium]|nr:UxaA family hydrolase [Bacillales bacterium]
MKSPDQTLMLKPEDKVAIALKEIRKGTVINVACGDQFITIELKDDIQFAHKFAVTDIEEGEDIIKYGEVIGSASRIILQGEHVHVHNLEGKRGRGDKLDNKQRERV